MAIHDLRDYPHDSSFHADICIIGSGPAGLAIATQFLSTATRVCVLESGGFDREPNVEALGDIDSVGLCRKPHDLMRCRTFGGTSAHWTGRSGVFDAIDFQARPWVPNSGWPISMADIEPFLDQAGQFLGLGPAAYSGRVWEVLGRRDGHLAWDKERLQPVVWQYSRHPAASAALASESVADGVARAEDFGVLQHPGAPQAIRLGMVCRPEIQASENVQVLLHANAVEIRTNDAGSQVCGVDVRTIEGKRAHVRADRVVLCCGAIDNARLLLSSRSLNPRGLGNDHDVVGRYLMDHPITSIASYQGRGSEALRRRLGHHWFDRRGTRYIYHTGLRLSPLEQRRQELLNCSIHLFEHGDGKYAESPVSAAGRLVRALKRRKIDQVGLEDIRQVVRHPVALLQGAYDRSYLRRPPLTFPSRVDVACVVEQVPDPNSRVTLSDRLDELGMNRARIDWRSADLEFETIRAMTSVVMDEIKRQGYALPTVESWLEEGADGFRSRISDSAHAMATTRMSSDPRQGVVDGDCMVHGVNGLYVAGGSVMSTGSHMNPTLMIVALGMRLANHLRLKVGSASIRGVEATPSRAPSVRNRVRVGIVGSGQRMQNVYLPILASLNDSFEIVGFTSRTSQKAEELSGRTGIDFFPSTKSLVSERNPDFLIVAVSNDSIERVQRELIDLGVPTLMETPFSWNIRNGIRNLKEIRQRQLLVGIAEQTPFLPLEQLKRKLLDLGVVGRVVAVCNDFHTYNYHGIAQLRSYIGQDLEPATADAVEMDLAPDGRAKGGNGSRRPDREKWLMGKACFSDGTMLLHNYSSHYFTSPVRGPRGIRIYGSHGTINNDEVMFHGNGDSPERAIVDRQMIGDRLKALTVQTSLGEVSWANPYVAHPFNDEQIAVATLLDQMKNAVLFGGLPAYTASEAFQDIAILTAMNYSARSKGRPVRLPLGYFASAAHAMAARLGRRR